jgi:hypothetical protein
MKLASALFLSILLLTPNVLVGAELHHSPSAAIVSERYWRTELYFGMGKRDGSEVSEDEWQRFLSDVVTPKFPDGLTVIEARGQYRTSAGSIIRERSRVLILLYPKKHRRDADKKIDAICEAYKGMFQQESVLRVTASKSSYILRCRTKVRSPPSGWSSVQ